MSSLLFDLESDDESSYNKNNSSIPLAARMRPLDFNYYIGQKHILSEGNLLKKAIDSDAFSSIIFHGPPGVGKTSLAELIARKTNSKFIKLSGVTLKVAELRETINNAITRLKTKGEKTIVFVDEIHRFNKAQQDSLLSDVEKGNIRFIGATTQNPYFYIISPLLSRSLVFRLNSLSNDEVKELIKNTLNSEKGFKHLDIDIEKDALDFLAEKCEGDARRALNALEIAVLTSHNSKKEKNVITLEDAEASIQSKSLNYGEDEHYDTISAFIKSMRGSDPDAAIYWLAKMIQSGEDISFIARRIVIFASEDVGNADPRAIQLAVSTMQGVEMIGMPEARILLSHAVTYCASAPKSNASYKAIEAAISDIENKRTQTIPKYLRTYYCNNSNESNNETYKYPHNYSNNYINQNYLSVNKEYYEPENFGYEKKIKQRLDYLKSLSKDNTE